MNAYSKSHITLGLTVACCYTAEIVGWLYLSLPGAVLWLKLTAWAFLAVSTTLALSCAYQWWIESRPKTVSGWDLSSGVHGKTADGTLRTATLQSGKILSVMHELTQQGCAKYIDDSPNTTTKPEISPGGTSTKSSTTEDSDTTLSWLRGPWLYSPEPSEEMTIRSQRPQSSQMVPLWYTPLRSAESSSTTSTSATELDSKTYERQLSEICSRKTDSSPDYSFYLHYVSMRLRQVVRNIQRDSSSWDPKAVSATLTSIAERAERVATHIKDSSPGT